MFDEVSFLLGFVKRLFIIACSILVSHGWRVWVRKLRFCSVTFEYVDLS